MSARSPLADAMRQALTVTSALALATALATSPARGQSFEARPAPISGAVTIDRTSVPNTDLITVSSPTAVIDWAPYDTQGTGVLNFQNAGTTATFQNAPGGGDFTVLNRIVPVDRTRPIAFNGNVISQLRAQTGAATRGGSVWFYSPGGIVVADGAVFDVGRLLLTTADPTGGQGVIGSTTGFTLDSSSSPAGIVNILSGATINALADNAYIAVVAPIVLSRGTIAVNGSAAFVAAEQAALTFNQGLFDIDVTVGSSAANGFPLQLRGTIGGPAQTGASPNHGIYAVAVPKNDAITMIVAPDGNLGFTPAASATVENGAIYLVAGGGLAVVPTSALPGRVRDLPNAPVAADLLFQPGATVTSQVAALASRAAELSSAGTATRSLAESVYLYGGASALVQANVGGALSFVRDVTVHSIGPTAGGATIRALAGATLAIGGTGAAYADLALADRPVPTAFTIGQGGTALIEARGTLNAVNLLASARGIATANQPTATGGTAIVSVGPGGTIAATGTVTVSAQASAFANGALGAGGAATLAIDGGTATIGGALAVLADGGLTQPTAGYAAGRGGTAQITTSAAGGTVRVTGATTISAYGRGRSSAGAQAATLGGGTGGLAAIQIAATTGAATTGVTLAAVDIIATGTGDSAFVPNAASGGAGTGGQAILQNGVGTTLTTNVVRLDASGTGGAAYIGQTAGSGTGGSANITARGTMTLVSATLLSVGEGGGHGAASGTTGVGQAGTTLAQATDGGVLGADMFRLVSTGQGGSILGGSGIGATGRGADARVVATASGRINATSVSIDAGATGGSGTGGAGGSATASTASISQGSGGAVTITGSATLSASATGGIGNAGAGGAGQGGDVRIAANDGTITIGNFATLSAKAEGGQAVPGQNGQAAAGGAATGGLTNIGATTGQVRIARLASLDSSATGGSSGSATGATATGGQALMGTIATGGTITAAGVTLVANGTGGGNSATNGIGGAGTGGAAQLFSTGTVTVTNVSATATGTGGDAFAAGGTGGAGTGGFALARANGGTLTADSLLATATGRGGTTQAIAAVDGGLGTGGLARIDAIARGTVRTISATATAEGIGGAGGGLGGRGGAGQGGDDRTNLTRGAYLVADGGTLTISSQALVQSGGTGGAGYGAGAGGAGTGGYANVVAFDGLVDASAASVFEASATGTGGAANALRDSGNIVTAGGGAGGAGIGGTTVVAGATTASAATAVGRTLFRTGAIFTANAIGGPGATGAPGQGGGAGGAATAGRVDVLAQAGNGVLVATGDLAIQANAIGGAGGAGGGAGARGAMGFGGHGGAGVGGLGSVGTSSAADTGFNAGTATFGNVTVAANATGGAGGSGGAGPGGVGGDATGGSYALIARGTPVRVGNLTMSANAAGGAGGGSSTGTAALSGAATAGSVGAIVSNRANRSERGSLAVGLVTLTASAVSTGGGATTAGAGQILVANGDATVASLAITSAGGRAGAERSYLSATGGTLRVTGATQASLVGDLGLYTGAGGLLNLASLTVTGTGTVGFGSIDLPSTVPGDITIGDAILTLGGDFVIGDSTGEIGGLTVTSAGRIATGILGVGRALSLTANNGGVTTGAVSAAGVTLASSGGAIAAGAITSTRAITLNGGRNVAGGALVAVNRIAATSGGALSLGDIESSGGAVTLSSPGALTVGNVRAAGSIGLTSAAEIRSGDLTAGTGPLAADASGGSGDGSGLIVPTGIAPGFDAAAVIRCDDCAGPQTMLGFTANYFGRTYTTTYVSNNGYLTFNSGQSDYTPTGLGSSYRGQPIIAAFFADVDTGNTLSAQTTYGTGTYGGRPAFAATWNGVGYYSRRVDKLNNFQIVLADRSDTGAGNFDIFYNYTRIQWETGEADDGINGLGGESAAVGFNAGTGNAPGTFFELPGSRVPSSFLDGGPNALKSLNNIGQIVFTVRNGAVVTPVAEAPTIRVNNTTAAAGAAPSITTGNLAAEAVEVRGAGQVRTGNITVADLGRDGDPGPTPLRTIVAAAGALTAGNVDGAGLITLTADRGDLFAGNVNGVGAITLDSNVGAITAASVAGRASVLVDADAGAITLGAASAQTILRAEASGMITLNGAVTAPTVELVASDMQVGTNATVTGGTTLTLTALSATAPATIGGTGAGAQGGYTLDAAEFGRLRGGGIRFVQQGRPAGEAQLVLRDLVLNGSDAPQGTAANLTGAAGAISFATDGTLRVTGDVRLNNAASGNSLSFRAGESFDLVTDAGGVGVFATGGALGGRLAIDAFDITVADAALLARSARTDFDDVTAAAVIAAIDAPAARTRPEGALQASRLELSSADFIAIQNSGTARLRGGFSAGQGGMTITRGTDAKTPLQIVINGRVAGTDGSFRTGAATAALITFATGQQAGGLDPRSTVNGCVIGATCVSAPAEIPEVVTIGANILGVIDTALPLSGDGFDAIALPETRFVDALDSAALNTDGIITDPVAAGGNPSLRGDAGTSTEDEERRRRRTGGPAAGVRP